MSCGKKPLVKNWDKPRNIRVTKPSRYEKNEACVKLHWKNVLKELELSYKDDKFWETQSGTVRQLVGPVIYERLAKIFGLQLREEPYVPASEPSVIADSEQFYVQPTAAQPSLSKIGIMKKSISTAFFVSEEGEEEEEEEQEEEDDEDSLEQNWSLESLVDLDKAGKGVKKRSLSFAMSTKSLERDPTTSKVNISRMFNQSMQKSFSSRYFIKESQSSLSSLPSRDDDLLVEHKSVVHKRRLKDGRIYNPHFELLYCSETEADMIKWESKYIKKALEVSASDECSKKAELLTKQVCYDFFDWWTKVGSSEYKSEVRCPADLESLFQIWFDEHASRGLVLDPKTMPCVLRSIANYCGVPQNACAKALKRQIAWDIRMETMPAHTTAFNSSLPQKMKHIPPRNKTAEMWRAVDIPEDLKSMTAIWGDIQHLTSTKEFSKWLQMHPNLPVPPCLQSEGQDADKKQLFVSPSDYVVREGSADFSAQELNIPVSQFSMEIKEVLSKLMHE